QIPECETVMHHHKIDRVPRTAAGEQIRRSRESRRQLPGRNRNDSQIVLRRAQGIPITAIPFRPTRRKATELIRITSDRPGLSKEVNAIQLTKDPVDGSIVVAAHEVEATGS